MVEAGIEHFLLRVHLRSLLQIAELQVVVPDDLAVVISLMTHQDRHQGRLARTVTGDESHLLLLRDGKGDVVEQYTRTDALSKVLDI